MLIIGCMILSGLGTGLLLVLHSVAGIAASWVIVGACTMVFTVTFYTLRHELVPQELLGRVVALTRTMTYIAPPVAPIVGGALLAAGADFAVVLVLPATVQVGTGLVALFTPLRRATGVRAST